MKTGKPGIELIKEFESCRLAAYKCPAGIWTIGYGHTKGVKQGDVINHNQAEQYLCEDLKRFEKNVLKYHEKYAFSQNEFDALVSFAFNIGSIDKLTAKGTRDKKTIHDKMGEYVKGGGKILSGLERRRKAEQELFRKK